MKPGSHGRPFECDGVDSGCATESATPGSIELGVTPDRVTFNDAGTAEYTAEWTAEGDGDGACESGPGVSTRPAFACTSNMRFQSGSRLLNRAAGRRHATSPAGSRANYSAVRGSPLSS